jgi:Fe-S-cluster-containing dehydrogenase component
MPAVRNIRLCTKDCLCLYVCPTGATDTETGQIDAGKCLPGCRACVDSCPSHAISLAPDSYPQPQPKTDEVAGPLMKLAESKLKQARIADGVAQSSSDADTRQIADAVAQSNRLMAEDLLRESGYLLPQSDNVRALLKELLEEPQDADFPANAAKRLLELL